MALRRFSAVSRPTIHKTNPEVPSRRLPVVIAELKDKGPILSKLVFCRAATKEMIGTTLAFGIRAPTRTTTQRIASSKAWQCSAARNGCWLECTSSIWRLPLQREGHDGRQVPSCLSPLSSRGKHCEEHKISGLRVREDVTMSKVGEGIHISTCRGKEACHGEPSRNFGKSALRQACPSRFRRTLRIVSHRFHGFLPLQFRPRCEIGSDMRHVEIQNPSKHGPAASLAAFNLYLNARGIGWSISQKQSLFYKSSHSLQPIWFTII